MDYGRGESISSEFRQTISAFVDHYSALAKIEGAQLKCQGGRKGERSQFMALRNISLEKENVFAALEHALGGESAHPLNDIAFGIPLIFQMRESPRLGIHLYELLLEKGMALDDQDLINRATVELAFLEYLLDNYENARRYAQSLRATQHRGIVAELNLILGAISLQEGKYEDSKELIVEALDVFRGMDEEFGVVGALIALGDLWEVTGKYKDALECFNQADDRCAEIGNVWGRAASLTRAGVALSSLGRFSESEENQIKAIEICLRMQDESALSTCYNNLAIAKYRNHDLTGASEFLRQSLLVKYENGDRSGQAISLSNLGVVLHELGEMESSRQILKEALSLQRELGNTYGQAEALRNLATLARTAGSLEESLELITEAYRLGVELDSQWIQSASQYSLGMLHFLKKEFRPAAKHLELAVNGFKEMNAEAQLLQACTAAAACLLQSDFQQGAAKIFFSSKLISATRHHLFDKDEQSLIDATGNALTKYGSSLDSPAADLAAWKSEGEAMSLDELVEFTLAALGEAQSESGIDAAEPTA